MAAGTWGICTALLWYYESNGESAGPVDDIQLRRLAEHEAVTGETLVWNADLPDWQRYADAAPASGLEPARVVCAECGEEWPLGETLQFGGAHVCAACKPVFFLRVKQGTVFPTSRVYGGFWIRFCAKFIDGIVTGTFQATFQLILHTFLGDENPVGVMLAAMISGLAGFFFSILYATWFVGRFGATPGKMACGLKVIRSDGSEVSYARALGRAFADILSGIVFCIGYLIAAFDLEKRTLHDHICDTRVIYDGSDA